MRKYVKFKGKFRDLIPDGWTFQKLFARNYRQYHKTCDGEKYSQGCSIWQHLGGYMEIEDLFSDSAIIVEQIASGKISDWISQITNMWGHSKTDDVCWMYQDMLEKKFYPYHSAEYRAIRDAKWDAWKKHEAGDTEAFDKWHDEYMKHYREKNFNLKLFDMVKKMCDNGWIEVQEDRRKTR